MCPKETWKRCPDGRGPAPVTNTDQSRAEICPQVTGNFLYFGRAVDSTLLTPLSDIASQQASLTERTKQHTMQLLNYIALREDAVLTYHASDMSLVANSDAGCQGKPEARSRVGGHIYLSNNVEISLNNGSIHNMTKIIKAAMSSAAEAELSALFINAREAVYLRNTLTEM